MAEINDNEMKHALKQAEKRGRRKGWFARIRTFIVGVLVGMLILTLFTAYMHGLAVKDTFRALFTTETAVEDRDFTLINHRIFGYKSADFAEAVLGDKEQLKKLEVYSREVSDVVTLTQAGLFKIKAFSKYQLITYNGKAVYTVDLSGLTADDITLDEETKTVTMKVPAPVLEPINIPSESIQFGEVEKEAFAFGNIKLTPEQQAEVETQAKDRMLQKLDEEKVIEEAGAAAEHSIWEIFQPMISNLSSKYKLKVEFK
ncbi:MAG: DUF4230 domain-containing protein [Mogibacterium sp.]|nr:DUF4230 domain-containing protein [Mogibacterium sp.]